MGDPGHTPLNDERRQSDLPIDEERGPPKVRVRVEITLEEDEVEPLLEAARVRPRGTTEAARKDAIALAIKRLVEKALRT